MATREEELEEVLCKLTIVLTYTMRSEGQLLGFSVAVAGGGRELVMPEERSASLCRDLRAQSEMNIWSSAADCAWALNSHKLSLVRHLTSTAGQ